MCTPVKNAALLTEIVLVFYLKLVRNVAYFRSLSPSLNMYLMAGL